MLGWGDPRVVLVPWCGAVIRPREEVDLTPVGQALGACTEVAPRPRRPEHRPASELACGLSQTWWLTSGTTRAARCGTRAVGSPALAWPLRLRASVPVARPPESSCCGHRAHRSPSAARCPRPAGVLRAREPVLVQVEEQLTGRRLAFPGLDWRASLVLEGTGLCAQRAGSPGASLLQQARCPVPAPVCPAPDGRMGEQEWGALSDGSVRHAAVSLGLWTGFLLLTRAASKLLRDSFIVLLPSKASPQPTVAAGPRGSQLVCPLIARGLQSFHSYFCLRKSLEVVRLPVQCAAAFY